MKDYVHINTFGVMPAKDPFDKPDLVGFVSIITDSFGRRIWNSPICKTFEDANDKADEYLGLEGYESEEDDEAA